MNSTNICFKKLPLKVMDSIDLKKITFKKLYKNWKWIEITYSNTVENADKSMKDLKNDDIRTKVINLLIVIHCRTNLFLKKKNFHEYL